MSKLNYERMYKELTNQIVRLKGTDSLGQRVETRSVINLLNIVEDKEKELIAMEPKHIEEQTEPVTNDIETKLEIFRGSNILNNPQNNIRDFARNNRIVKD